MAVVKNGLDNTMEFKNSHYGCQFSVHSIEDDEEFEKARAMVRLLTEINKGIQSGEEQGWLSDEDIDKHFIERRKQKEKMLMDQN
ncbi:MAG: hypothetical protein J6N76_00220 [Lachnospiraceae bacterium]|nr:hypothetical protein [Lachnospiraceae bacterium]